MESQQKKTTSEDEHLLRINLVKLEETLALKELNDELLDANHNLLSRTIQFCRKNNIPIDNEMKALITRVRHILQEMQNPSPQRKHPDRTPQESTVYIFVHYLIVMQSTASFF